MFTRDVLPLVDSQPPDLAWLRRREQELGISLRRMLASERHLLDGRSYSEIMRLAEVVLRVVERSYRANRPDFVFSEDVSCFCSYVHYAVAREMGIPFWSIGSARIPYRLSVYSGGLQRWEATLRRFEELCSRGLSPEERAGATAYVEGFTTRPSRPTGMETRARPPRITRGDVGRFGVALQRYLGDSSDPTASPPTRVLWQRAERIVRERAAARYFERPVPGERYVLYPIHFQPEASTLVQAPYYVDQINLLEDIARSLPVGYRLYVKEHLSNRGRRPLEFYRRIRSILGVRLLGPDEDTWRLIAGASAIAVITGTMGWEGLLFGRPVITFGDVFYNAVPHVHRGSEVPKDRWYEMFDRALHRHQPDADALLCFVAAIQQTSYPGFMKNPNTFPEVLREENVSDITRALAVAAGLAPS